MEVVTYRVDAALRSRAGTGTAWLIGGIVFALPAAALLALMVLAGDDPGGAIAVFFVFVVPLALLATPCFVFYRRASADVAAGRALLELARTQPKIATSEAIAHVANGRNHVLVFLTGMHRQGWIADATYVPPVLGVGAPAFAFPPVAAPTPVAAHAPVTPFPGTSPSPYAAPPGSAVVGSGPVGSAVAGSAPSPPATPLHGGFAPHPVHFGPGLVLADRWRIERQIGEGGMGAVFVVAHTRTAKRYALKVILGDGARSEQAVARFEREALTVSGLRHPGIVQVHDYDRAADGSPYLVMDLLEGEPLDARLERLKSVPFQAARQWVVEAARALAVAHEKGLVHRDIKPGNLFLAQDGSGSERVVVLDFGVVKTADEAASLSLTRTGAPIGTPMYMAPEQFRGDGVDARADIWALATVLYQAIAGETPYPAESMAELTVAVLTQPVPAIGPRSARPVPPGLDGFFARALAKDKHARFASFAEFEAALLAL